jgi:hypothetical protein
MKLSQQQHLENKHKLFENVVIQPDNIDQYIFTVNNNKNNTQYIKIKINKISTTFVGKYENIDILKERAIKFINELVSRQCNQIAGSPLEPQLPSLCGNA